MHDLPNRTPSPVSSDISDLVLRQLVRGSGYKLRVRDDGSDLHELFESCGDHTATAPAHVGDREATAAFLRCRS